MGIQSNINSGISTLSYILSLGGKFKKQDEKISENEKGVKENKESIEENAVDIADTKADIHATSYTFTGLKAGTTYNFAVKPYLKDGNTPVWAKTYTGLTAFTKPAKVAGFKVASKTRTSVKTTWAKTTGATAYRVYKVVGGKWVKVKDVTGTSYTFTGLKKNTSYKFRISTIYYQHNSFLKEFIFYSAGSLFKSK